MNRNLFFRSTIGFTVYVIIIASLAVYPLYKFADATIIIGSISNMLLFYLSTLAAIFLVVWAGKKHGTIVNAFLASTIIKILLAMVYLLISLKFHPGHELEFTLTFFAAYLICTGFEIYWILSNLREI